MSIILDGSTGITLPTGAEVVSTTGTQTLTNKTLSGANNTINNLNASNLSSGTVATARLGSGTADSTTFLRGDQTWATVSTTPTTSQVLNATAGAAAGDVGTYASLSPTANTAYAVGATAAGSALRFTGPLRSTGTSANLSSTVPSGTWRCMGFITEASGAHSSLSAVWLRIS